MLDPPFGAKTAGGGDGAGKRGPPGMCPGLRGFGFTSWPWGDRPVGAGPGVKFGVFPGEGGGGAGGAWSTGPGRGRWGDCLAFTIFFPLRKGVVGFFLWWKNGVTVGGGPGKIGICPVM